VMLLPGGSAVAPDMILKVTELSERSRLA